MIEKTKVRLIIRIIAFIIIIITCFFALKNYKRRNTNIETIQPATIKITSDSMEDIEIYDLEIAILYDNVWVPMNEIFRNIYREDYKENANQEITDGDTRYIIENDKNKIIIPKYVINDSATINNTIEVEIEEYNSIKYIPLYLISNIDNMSIKLDGKEIYDSNKYISSIEALNNNSLTHSIEITKKEKENNETYEGQLKGSLWREVALKRIEKYRKKEIKITAKNQNDVAIKNVSFNTKMNNNDFKFGTAIGDIKSVNNYSNISRELFNIVGSENGFKWRGISILGYKRPDGIVEYSKNNNMRVRGHVLWLDTVNNKNVEKIVNDPENNETITMTKIYEKYSNGDISYEEANHYANTLIEQLEDLAYSHIEEVVKRYPDVNEWDVVNEITGHQYFKFYLFEKDCIKHNYFTKSKTKSCTVYNDNDEYYRFIANCFEKARENNLKAKLVWNTNSVLENDDNDRFKRDIRAIKNVKEYTNNIDSIGVQCHIANNLYRTPQSYFNTINSYLQQSGIKEACITEYDNYTSEKLGNYTTEENKTRADYLRDTLIMAYSNPNISEFCFWVYNGKHFCDEERQAYEEFVTPLLNYTESGTSDENGYSTRLYKGEYEATIKLKNGKEKTVNFTVSDDSSDTVEVVFESDVEKIEVKQQPSKTEFYQNEDINLAGGKLTIYYDDDTTYEIDLTDKDVHINGYDSSKLGKQKVTIEYQGKETKLEVTVVENVDEIVKDNANNIIKINQEIKNNNSVIFSDKKVSALYDELINSINNFANNSETRNQNTITEIYNKQIELAETIFDEYKSEKLENVESETVINVVKEIINITDEYSKIFSYYVSDDNIQINPDVMETINLIIEKYNSHTHVDIRDTTELVEKCKDLYNNSINTEIISNNYLNKLRIINTCEIISKIIDYDIYLDDENKIKNNEIYTQNNNLIRNIDVNTTPNTLINNLKISDSHKVYRNNEKLAETSSIATGDILKVNNNTYVLIVKGDIDGNGVVNVADLVKYRKYLLELDELKDLEVYAADTNLDNQLKVGDLVGIRKIILNN